MFQRYDGLSKAEVLAGLYNASKPQGLGFLHYDPRLMGVEEAQALLDGEDYPSFDYLRGRVMKVDLEQEGFDDILYDRVNGRGAAARVMELLRNGKAQASEPEK